jgi:hypothetical protein
MVGFWCVDINKSLVDLYNHSYDLDFYNTEPSANHGLAEYKALMSVIKKDTPINPY